MKKLEEEKTGDDPQSKQEKDESEGEGIDADDVDDFGKEEL